MAEFQMVAKNLERLCDTYRSLSKCGTDECPLYCENLCCARMMIHVHGDDAGRLEDVVMGGCKMSDFVQTMKDWRRMCKHYSDEGMKNGQPSCKDMCPLGRNTVCGGIIEDALDSDIEVAAKEVAKWAAENPEPVYPTWYEWLSTTPFIEKVKCGSGTYKVYNWKKPIPADIAEKLGIEPK